MTKQIRARLTPKEYALISDHRGGKNIGVIGDTHEPFCLPGYRDFCYETFDQFGCGRIVHIGDEIDAHAMSYHESDPDGQSAGDEADNAQTRMDLWYKTFPNVDVLIGNHTEMHYRKARTANIPTKFIKDYREAWNAPDGWNWHEQLIIDDVLLEHGTGSSGQMAAINRARDHRMSTAIGHIHSFGGVMYSASERDLIFGLNVGCGIDVKTYAMRYGKKFSKRPTIGCGVIMGKVAFFVPMDLGSKIQYK